MMKFFLVFSTMITLAACSNNKNSDETEKEILPEGTEIKLWRSDLDSTGKLLMVQDNFIIVDTLIPERVITHLNGEFPRVQMVLERISNDTIFVAIPEPTFLTQQMGSSGPVMFFSSAVYNLTEIPGIKRVSFNFEEGDHASPGVLSRDDIKNN